MWDHILVHYMGDTFTSVKRTVALISKANDAIKLLSASFVKEQPPLIKKNLHISFISHDLIVG